MANLAELVTYGTKRHGKAKTVDNSVSSLTFSTISLVEAITSFLGTDRLKLTPETLRGIINVKTATCTTYLLSEKGMFP